jgi:outer membrane protein assembly factor BamB
LPTLQEPDEWNQFRGPRRDGVVRGFTPPDRWPEALRPVWTLTVGTGKASPVVRGRQAFVHSRRDGQEVVSLIDLEAGTVVWRDEYAAPSEKAQINVDSEGDGPYATPLVDGDRVFTVGVNAVVSAYGLAGERLWQRDFGELIVEMDTFCGLAPSPLFVDGRLIVQVGDSDSNEILALDPSTGATVWRWTGPGISNASPNLFVLDGVRQVVAMTDLAVVGLDPATGSELWSYPFAGVPGSCSTNIPSPLLHGDALILTGVANGTVAIGVRKSDDGWTVEPRWQNAGIGPFWSNVVSVGNEVFGVSYRNRGQLFSVEAETGETLWTTAGRSGDNGSLVVAGEFVLVLMSGGDLRVTRPANPGLETVATYDVADTTAWVYPLVLEDGFLIKAGDTLTRWSFD